jgi:hypothetical protein
MALHVCNDAKQMVHNSAKLMATGGDMGVIAASPLPLLGHTLAIERVKTADNNIINITKLTAFYKGVEYVATGGGMNPPTPWRKELSWENVTNSTTVGLDWVLAHTQNTLDAKIWIVFGAGNVPVDRIEMWNRRDSEAMTYTNIPQSEVQSRIVGCRMVIRNAADEVMWSTDITDVKDTYTWNL